MTNIDTDSEYFNSDIEFDSDSDNEYTYESDNDDIISRSMTEQLNTSSENQYVKRFSLDVEILAGYDNVHIPKVYCNDQHILFEYYCGDIPDELCSIIGMDKDTTIGFEFKFESQYLHNNNTRPDYKIFNAGLLQTQLKNCINKFIEDEHLNLILEFQEYLASNKEYYNGRKYLLCLFNYIKKRILNPGAYCNNCGIEHKYPGLVPINCGSDFCLFQTLEIEYINDMLVLIKTRPASCDIIINFAYLACMNKNRCNKVFNDFPEQIQTNYDDVERHKIIMSIIDGIPSINTLCLAKDENELQNIMNKKHELGYYLFKWILTTTSSHIELIDKNNDEFINDVPVKNNKITAVFKYLTNPPERELVFNEIKQKEGVKILQGFHGSPSENWHSIIRTSLKNYSGTENQLHGAAHGNGIYLAPDYTTSLGYTGNKYNLVGNHNNDVGWKNSMYKNKYQFMTSCEIIDDGSKGYSKMSNGYYVINNENLVRTKYLIVC